MASIDDHKISEYLYMLKISQEYIVSAFRDYDNQDHIDNNNYHDLYHNIDYHLFSFSQIVYALYERLVNKYPKSQDEIKKFFKEDSTNNVYKINIVANHLKHFDSNANLTSQPNIAMIYDKDKNTLSIDKVEEDRSLKENIGIMFSGLKDISKFAFAELVAFIVNLETNEKLIVKRSKLGT